MKHRKTHGWIKGQREEDDDVTGENDEVGGVDRDVRAWQQG